ncbi:hypothetical protein G6F63_014027 [Rhizopus arrhizus]|nr:hypothetical protein G6F63_014027 [Rhizopus arrhizus]
MPRTLPQPDPPRLRQISAICSRSTPCVDESPSKSNISRIDRTAAEHGSALQKGGRSRETVEGGVGPVAGVSAAWARGMPRAGWAGRPTPVLPCAQERAHEQAAAKPTRTYLRRPRTPTPPRHPAECQLLLLLLPLPLPWLGLPWLEASAGAGRSPAEKHT